MSVDLFVDVLVYSVDLCISFWLVPYCFDDRSFAVYFENGGKSVLLSQGCFGYLRSFLAPHMF